MIVLASGSPRRRQLLEMIGLEFRVVPPEVDESLGPAEQAAVYVTPLAREKATTVAGRERGAVVLAADTTVVLRGTIFGKPANPEEAAEMLRQLEGRKHQVMTAVAGSVLWAVGCAPLPSPPPRRASPPYFSSLALTSVDFNRQLISTTPVLLPLGLQI